MIGTDAAQEQYLGEFFEPVGYLDHARVGPPSRAVARAIGAAVDATVSAGPSTVDELMAAKQRVIDSVARLSGFPSDGVTLVPNTSLGLFQVAFALSGEVAVGSGEFPSNRYPWARAAQAGLLTVRDVPSKDGRMTPDTVAAALTRDTTALAVSAVDFATGYRADLVGLREVIGDRLLIVDGIQGFGAVDLPWTVADALVVGGQKWLRAGWGTGFIALSQRALDRLHPVLSGWTGVAEPTRYDGSIQPALTSAERFSITNLSPAADAGFLAALGLVESVGPRWIEERIAERVDEMLAALTDLGAVLRSPLPRSERAGIISFRLPKWSERDLHLRLVGSGISATQHDQYLRISVHATTGPESVEALAAVLR
jgi:selenocysteine lyase/cysteine desulfurase